VADGYALPDGGFATVPLDVPAPLVRARDGLDGAVPAAEPSAALLLAEAAVWSGRDDWRAASESALEATAELAQVAPTAAVTALLAARALRRPAHQVAVVGAADDPRTTALLDAARTHPGAPAVARVDGPDDPLTASLPWLAGREAIEGRPTAYACAAGVCRLPVREPVELAAELAALDAGADAGADAGRGA
jgi:uncharacterized protein